MKNIFPFIFIQLSRRAHISLAHRRAFTLVELMIVVVLITLLAAIAVPSIGKQMSMYAAKQDAEQVAALYRGARLHAMGRGSAVSVQYNNGIFTVREAIRGNAATLQQCDTLPVSSCTLNPLQWTNPTLFSVLNTVDYSTATNLTVGARTRNAGGAELTPGTLNICFTPLGAAYADSTGQLTRLTGSARFDLQQAGAPLDHSVVISPLGATRVVVMP